MEHFITIIQRINNFIWGFPLLLLVLGTHIYFTIKLRFPQKNIVRAIRYSFTKKSDISSANLSVFETLTTTLAATLGTGNIVGISTAIWFCGPGALFWCWLTGLLGMATAYAECYLSVRYRIRGADELNKGGPMYLWDRILHCPSIGKMYAFLTILTAFLVGCTTQANSITQATSQSFGISPHFVGILVAIPVGAILLGGVKVLGTFCARLVPPMAFLYIGSCLLLLFFNRSVLPDALHLIMTQALSPQAAAGGALGSSLILAVRFGIARGLFTNEAGMGTCAVTAAGSESGDPRVQGYVSMSAVFWDTVVMCLVTGLVIVSNGLKNPASILTVNEAGLTHAAFSYLPFSGDNFLTLCLIAFAITTMVGWSYLGERAIEYLKGPQGILPYRFFYILMIYFGAILPLDLIWECTDLINALILLPNILSLYLLRKKIHT